MFVRVGNLNSLTYEVENRNKIINPFSNIFTQPSLIDILYFLSGKLILKLLIDSRGSLSSYNIKLKPEVHNR